MSRDAATAVSRDWEEANRDALLAELDVLRAWLRAAPAPTEQVPSQVHDAEAALALARAGLSRPTALDRVVAGFSLTAYERAVLLLAAGPELAAGVGGELIASGGSDRPTFGLTLSALPGAHWSAITPQAPLRRWRLIHLLDPTSPTHSPLVVDERVLHELLEAGGLDPELAAIARPAGPGDQLPPTLQRAGEEVAGAWRSGRPVVLTGPQPGNLVVVAATAAATLRRALWLIEASDLPSPPADRERLARLVEREAVIGQRAWALDATRITDLTVVVHWLNEIDAPAALLTDLNAPPPADGAIFVSVPRVPIAERRAALVTALAERRAPRRALAAASDSATAFDLALPDLQAAAQDAADGRELWSACRLRAARRFDGLAQVIAPRAGWDDLVLPPAQLQQLQAMVAALRSRARVLDDWGFAGRSGRGLGTAALFAGPSGTGKTLAAEVVASALDLDLVVVDLSQVVSKYIGETEKNLRRVFEAAEGSAAVLVFDEADTLFGKRTEVRDSHDRYANLEVGYLLQRIESFRGLAVLTTNAKSVLDQAFLRRLRFVVSFPYPDAAARERLWRLAFPDRTPTTDLDPARLAAIDLPGGGIAAAALTAAYLGAEQGEVTAAHVAAATRWELAKLGRSAASR